MTRHFRLLLVFLAFVAFGTAACGDDDGDGDGDAASSAEGVGETAGTEATAGLDPEFVELFQTQLAAVGCYDGPIDGIDGPATNAAIVNFQRAQGLGEDGVVGPETEGALQAAVDAGSQVCFPSGDGSEEGDDEGALDGATEASIVSVSSPSYGKDFAVSSCTNPGETTVSLTAEADGIVLQVDATDGVGTLFISGGDEQDGVDLAGTVTSVAVGDAGDLTIEGTFDSDGGEAFTVTGSCA